MLRTMIHRVFIAIIVGANFVNIPAARASDNGALLLVKDGQPQAQIIIGEEPERLVKLAAQELRDYVQKISGAELPVVAVPDPDLPVRILVGRSAETDALGIDGDELKHGAFRMVTGPDYVVLIGFDFDFEPHVLQPQRVRDPDALAAWDAATREYTDTYWGLPLPDIRSYHEESGTWGSDQSGSLNAVYELLRMWGVRWYYPGEVGEVVPETTTLTVPALDKTVTPDFSIRSFGAFYHGAASWDDIFWRLRLGLGGGYRILPSGPKVHGHRVMHSREEMRQQHPEFYALGRGGQRSAGRRARMCYRSKGLLEETIRYVRVVFDVLDEPAVDLWPNDGFGMCQCEKCAGLTPAEVIFPFVKRVAEEVIKTHPDRLITCGAYSSYRFPPDSLDKFPPNVAVTVAFQRPGLDDPESWGFRYGGGFSYEDLMEGWMSKVEPGNILGNSNFRGGGMVITRSIAADLRFRKGRSMGDWNEVGIRRQDHRAGVFAGRMTGRQAWLLGLHHINLYVNARLLWDADQDLDALMNEYYEKYYGPVAGLMKEAIEMAENSYTRGRGVTTIPLEAQLEVIELIEQAREKAGDTVYGRRIAYILKEEPSLEHLRASLQAAEARSDVREFWTLMNFETAQFREEAGTFELDGKVDEPFWTVYPHGGHLLESSTGERPGYGTRFMMRWQRDHLYVGVKCESEDVRQLNFTATEDGDPAILEGDSVTLLIETQDHSHYEITVNPAGAIFDADHSEGGEGTRWTAQAEAAAHIGDGYWSAELRIPVIDRHDDPLHKVVGREPVLRYPWYFNVIRRHGISEGEIELSAWEPTGTKDFQDPLTFGRIYVRPRATQRRELQEQGVRLGPREIAK